MSTTLLAGALSVLLAIVTYALNRYATLQFARRQARLDRVNRQLTELYGPLLSIFSVSKISIHSLRSKLRPGQAKYFRGGVEPLSDSEYARWRLWLLHVFGPGNRHARDLIYDKADLLIDQEIPPCLLAWCAQTQEYEVIFKQWEDGDYSEPDATREFSEFASELEDYLEHSYRALKAQQNELLRSTSPQLRFMRRAITTT